MNKPSSDSGVSVEKSGRSPELLKQPPKKGGS